MGREGSWPVNRIIEATDNARKELWGVSPESLTGKGKKRGGAGDVVKVLPKNSVEVAPKKTEVPPYLYDNVGPNGNLGEVIQAEEERKLVDETRDKKMQRYGEDNRPRNRRIRRTIYKTGENGELVGKKVTVIGKRYGDKYKDERKGRI